MRHYERKVNYPDIVGPYFHADMIVNIPEKIWSPFERACEEQGLESAVAIILLMRQYADNDIPEITSLEVKEHHKTVLGIWKNWTENIEINSTQNMNDLWKKMKLSVPNLLATQFQMASIATGVHPDSVLSVLMDRYAKQEIDSIPFELAERYCQLHPRYDSFLDEEWMYYVYKSASSLGIKIENVLECDLSRI